MLKAFGVSVGEWWITVDNVAAATVGSERWRSRRTVFVVRSVRGAFDCERYVVPSVLVQFVGWQVDGLRAGSVSQLQRDRSGRVHVAQAPGGGPSGRVLAGSTNVRQETVATAVVRRRFRHPMVV